MKISEIKTPLADKVLQIYTFKTKEGIRLNDTFTHGQKVIMECILGRKAPSLLETIIKRIHVMAHTRYGKSIAIAAAVSVRASGKREPWAVVSGTKEQAQIIMDYVIQFSTSDPIMSAQLADSALIKTEKMTQRRKRNHITFVTGGEVRAYGAGKDGTAVMGQGCANVIEDESALLNDSTHSKIFRMLGDHMDNFYMKVGNPFNNNHFKLAYIDPLYFHINIDYRQGLIDGRLSESFVEEVRNKPNFGILYENVFPDEDMVDEKGYLPLFTHSLLDRAFVSAESIEPWGFAIDGCDPADSGDCETIIVRRWQNVAKIQFTALKMDPVSFATEVAVQGRDSHVSIVDKIGVGSGTWNVLKRQMGTKSRTIGINAGNPVPNSVPAQERELYENVRAYLSWQAKVWLEQGNKLIKDEADRWKQLLAMKYKTNKKGKIQIISKDELRKAPYLVSDVGVFDGLIYTFLPYKISTERPTVKGGMKPFDSKLGF